jgi:Ca-activated chloride channel family protein
LIETGPAPAVQKPLEVTGQVRGLHVKMAGQNASDEAPAGPRPEGKMGKSVVDVLGHGSGSSVGLEQGISAALGTGGLGLKGVGSGGGGGYGSGVGLGSLGTRGRGGDAISSGEDYGRPTINEWTLTASDHLSTFGADVDTASYTLARAKLLAGALPPADSVRVEEWVNYFSYAYPQPEKGVPLAVFMDAAPSPFNPSRAILRVGVQGRTIDLSERKLAHLTFLVDVSGSMQSPERLPLAKKALRLLVDQLHDGDTVALVTYAGGVKLVLPHTGLEHKAQIHAAIEGLTAGGSTAMNSGIELAYQQAVKVLDSKSISRVIVLSDGDANVGATSHEAILRTIEGHVKEGVSVTTVGFGMGNYKSALMEQLADKGNGNHFYVDSLLAAKRIFVEQLGGTLQTIAQDVKLQVDFDPAQVTAYRLIGYENRDLADRDFRNDRVDAGEIGSGHRVTALYEVELKAGAGQGLATVRVRAKAPRGTVADEKAFVFAASSFARTFEAAPVDLRFATAVMGAAEIFRRSPEAAEWDYELVRAIARGASADGNAERAEFNALLEHARSLAPRVATR